jgi:CBS domain-containing protein
MTTLIQRDGISAVDRQADVAALSHGQLTVDPSESSLPRYLDAVATRRLGPPSASPRVVAPTVVADVMALGVISARTDTVFKDVVSLLARNRLSSLPVVNAAHQVVGVVSEADLLAQVAGDLGRAPGVHRFAGPGDQHRAVQGSTARDLMTAPAVTVEMYTPVAEAVRLAARAKVRRMPVVDQHGRLVGIVTRGDLLRPFLRGDLEIEEEIRGFIRRGMKLTDPTVGVSVCEGVVTLTGELDRQLAVRRLIDHVNAISGVIEVRNRLTTRHNDAVVPFAFGPRPAR